MLNLIMEYIISPDQSKENIENVLRKSNIYMQILNQLNDLSINDINGLDNKLDSLFNYQIEEIKNLQYQLNKVKIDFIELNLEQEIAPDFNFFNIKILFLLFVFLFLSNLVLAFFSK